MQLRSAGGVTPLAQLVCFPDPAQGQDSTFTLIAFGKDIATTLRAKGMPVPKLFVAAASAPEKEQFVLEWAFNHGVEMHKEPAVLHAVPGSKGHMWVASYGKHDGKTFEVRETFEVSGRYSREVLVNGTVAVSVYGQCEPADSKLDH